MAMGPGSEGHAAAYAAAVADEARTLDGALRGVESAVDALIADLGIDDASDVAEAVTVACADWPLEVTVERDGAGAVRAVCLLVTVGGPRAEVWMPVDGGSARVDVWWGSDQALEMVEVPALAGWFADAYQGGGR